MFCLPFVLLPFLSLTCHFPALLMILKSLAGFCLLSLGKLSTNMCDMHHMFRVSMKHARGRLLHILLIVYPGIFLKYQFHTSIRTTVHSFLTCRIAQRTSNILYLSGVRTSHDRVAFHNLFPSYIRNFNFFTDLSLAFFLSDDEYVLC